MLNYSDRNHDPCCHLDQARLPDSQMAGVAAGLADPAPLVLAAAVSALELNPAPAGQPALLRALGDESRLVRIRAANALTAYPAGLLPPDDRARLAQATQELLDSLQARPDDGPRANLGNYYFRQHQDASPGGL
jgi:hypothetical protein